MPVPRPSRSNRGWLERVRSLGQRRVRESEQVCYVEGIRQVLSALEGGHEIEAVLIDPSRLRSETAWATVDDLRGSGVEVVALRPVEFERISSRDNPVGIAAIVRWFPQPLADLAVRDGGLYVVTDDVRDPGNLGTIARTLDAAGGHALIVHGGTDAGHPGALRASLGTMFRLPVHSTSSLDDVFDWARANEVVTIATSAKADHALWDTAVRLPAAVLVGNEGEGLAAGTVERCDLQTRIPMLGTATSLNVSVATGIILYEVRRQAMTRSVDDQT